MPQFTMSVKSVSLAPDQPLDCGAMHTAALVLSGEVSLQDRLISSEQGVYCAEGDELRAAGNAAEVVLFELHGVAVGIDDPNSEVFEWPLGEAVLRLDQISFPPGAIAYRHVHAGTGYRYLTAGQLEVRADDHAITVGPGDSWFEPANSPVRATNLVSAETAFIRAMVLPMDYLGKPTITYLNAEDADKPRLQSNQRFFDQVIDL